MKEKIQKFLKGDIADSTEIIDTYSRDASLFTVRPELVVFPKDAEDVCNLVKFVNEEKSNAKPGVPISLTARAAGTCMSGGPLNESIIMDFTKYMHGIIKFDEKSRMVTVLPGTYYRDLEKELAVHNLMLPSYTASKSLNAVGGMVGNNSGGELNLKYGKTERWIEELKIVLTDGQEYTIRALTKDALEAVMIKKDFEAELYRKIYELIRRNRELLDAAKPNVSKNSAGYYLWNVWQKNDQGQEVFDLNRLFVGSQGTLGIVTEITFRLVPIEPISKLAVIFLNDISNLGDIIKDILSLDPTSVESYDDKTFKLALKFFPDLMKQKGILETLRFGAQFLPEVFLTLTGGVPKLLLLVEFTGQEVGPIDIKMDSLLAKMKARKLRTHLTRSKREEEKYWTMRRDSFSLLRKHIRGMHTAPFIDDIIVRPEHLPTFLPELNAILGEYNLLYTIAGHAGDGNFHIIPLMDLKKSEVKDIILELSDRVYELVVKYKGSITAEHNDGIIRTPYLKIMYSPEVINLFAETKNIFDPNTILNPGKKVGGTKNDIDRWLLRENDPGVK